MKKSLFTTMFLGVALCCYAIVAKPGERTVVQPNGDTLTVRAYGDHRFHWLEDTEGRWIEQQADGYYRQIEKLSDAAIAERINRSPYAQVQRTAAMQNTEIPLNIAPRGLVILVNFKDKEFSTDVADIKAMIQSDNYVRDYSYTYGGKQTTVHSEGSAKTYFEDQSMGQYSPQFEVVGPYTVSQNMSYYGSYDDYYAYEMIIEACQLADEDGVDFTQYDCNNDGEIDFVYVIYAGYGEADSDIRNTIWPHTYYVSYFKTVKLDGKLLNTYACGNEIAYDSKQHAGIGTFVHEFSHVLGLPDLYATDYSSHKTMTEWDVMDVGPYNNSGNTPPAYSAYERFFCGWLTPTLLNQPASPILDELQTSNKAYIITKTGECNFKGNDPKPTEFYLIENRQNTKWDEHLPGHGMMITKVSYTYRTWTANKVNNTANNLGVDIIEADGKTNSSIGRQNDLFPSGADAYAPYEQYPITDIQEDGNRISFDFMGGADWITPMTTEAANAKDKKGRTYTKIEAIYDVSGNLITTDVKIKDLSPGFYIIQVGDDGEGKEHHSKGIQIYIKK